MSNIEVAKKNLLTLREMLTKSKNEIVSALPKHMDADRLARIALTTCQRNPLLLECDPKSVIASIITSAQLGLEPDNILGSAYLIPFWNSRNNRYEAQLIAGYKGLIDLARRSGQIKSITAHIVYENEICELRYGTENQGIRHIPLPPAERGQKIIGAYAVAEFKDGGYQFEFMWKEEIDKIKETSKNYRDKDGKIKESSTWVQYEEEMIKKTVIRRLCKYLPLSPELQRAVALDEMADAGIPQNNSVEIFGEVIDIETGDIAEKTEQKKELLKENLQAKKS